jgi:tetratricopeptide (TPR) repeat protein
MIDGLKDENMTNSFKFNIMKTKITLLISALILGLNFGFAQQDEECMTNLSIFSEYVKSKNYDAAYEPWMIVRNKCPKFNKAIYVYGERILKDKIDNSTGAEKTAYLNDLLKLWKEKAEHYPNDVKKGELIADEAQLMYDEKELLGKSDLEIYNTFDKAFREDAETFTNPKGLYTYFSLMVDLFDKGQKPAQDLFNKYDDIVEKIDSEIKNYTTNLNKLVIKEEAGTELTKKEEKYRSYYESYLSAYDKVSGSIDSKLGSRANCDNLIPLYSKDFETNKNNGIWLKRAVNRMASKECTDDPLFFKLVNAYHNTNPSADTAYYLGYLKDKEGRTSEAIKFYNQAIDLQPDPFEKSKILYKIGDKLRKNGNYSGARNYYYKALKENPSMGKVYLVVGQMYASSANNCGDDNFTKRAVYWKAAEESRKAGRVDSNLSSTAAKQAENYESKAPSKSEIFAKGNAGETISFKCWIGGSVKVPNI